MTYELECPSCYHKFTLNEEYDSGNCPNCMKAYYYWDHVLDEEIYEEFFEGYYWIENI